MQKLKGIAAGVVVTLAALLNCAAITDNEETGIEPAITGKLLAPGGKTPAAGIFVKLIRLDAIVALNNYGPAKTTSKETVYLTGDDGTYHIPISVEGTYVIEAIDPSGYGVRINHVVVEASDKALVIPDYALQKNGAFSGSMVLSDGGDFKNVFVLAYGSDRFTQAMDDGIFSMGNLPCGEYQLKLICLLPGYEDSRSVDVTIIPDDTVDLGEFRFEAKEIGAPAKISLIYDTLTWMVRLDWSRVMSGGNIAGYNIYRYDEAEADQYPHIPLNTTPVSDTFFVDSSVVVNTNYTYGVAAVTRDNRIGKRSVPVTMTVVPYRYSTDTITTTNQILPVGLRWTADKLMIGYNSDGHLTIDEYSDEGTFLRHKETSVPIRRGDHVQFDNDRYVIISSRENSVAGYDSGSLQRFHFALGTKAYPPCIRNDTIYAALKTNDELYPNIRMIINAYDTSGNVLFSVGEEQQLCLVTHSTDNKILTSYNHDYGWTIIVPDLKHGSADTVINFYPRGTILLDACGSRYLFLRNNGFMVVNNNGSEICAMEVQNFGLALQTNAAVISCTGKIAFISELKVVILRLPSNR